MIKILGTESSESSYSQHPLPNLSTISEASATFHSLNPDQTTVSNLAAIISDEMVSDVSQKCVERLFVGPDLDPEGEEVIMGKHLVYLLLIIKFFSKDRVDISL